MAKSNASLEALATRFNDQQSTNARYAFAYTAAKRGILMRDMQAMVGDYLSEGATDEDVATSKARLTQDVTNLHDTTVSFGIIKDVLVLDDAGQLYCNDTDAQWLMDQLQHDITQHQYDIWSK